MTDFEVNRLKARIWELFKSNHVASGAFKVLYEGDLLKLSGAKAQPRRCILLNNALIWCAVIKRGEIMENDTLLLKGHVILENCIVEDMSDSISVGKKLYPFAFKIRNQTKRKDYALATVDAKEKDQWLSAFSAAGRDVVSANRNGTGRAISKMMSTTNSSGALMDWRKTGEVICEGFLIKSPPSHSLKRRWHRRYFIMLEGSTALKYFRDERTAKSESGRPKGSIDVAACNAVVQIGGQSSPYPNTMCLESKLGTRVYLLAAPGKAELGQWFGIITQVQGSSSISLPQRAVKSRPWSSASNQDPLATGTNRLRWSLEPSAEIWEASSVGQSSDSEHEEATNVEGPVGVYDDAAAELAYSKSVTSDSNTIKGQPIVYDVNVLQSAAAFDSVYDVVDGDTRPSEQLSSQDSSGYMHMNPNLTQTPKPTLVKMSERFISTIPNQPYVQMTSENSRNTENGCSIKVMRDTSASKLEHSLNDFSSGTNNSSVRANISSMSLNEDVYMDVEDPSTPSFSLQRSATTSATTAVPMDIPKAEQHLTAEWYFGNLDRISAEAALVAASVEPGASSIAHFLVRASGRTGDAETDHLFTLTRQTGNGKISHTKILRTKSGLLKFNSQSAEIPPKMYLIDLIQSPEFANFLTGNKGSKVAYAKNPYVGVKNSYSKQESDEIPQVVRPPRRETVSAVKIELTAKTCVDEVDNTTVFDVAKHDHPLYYTPGRDDTSEDSSSDDEISRCVTDRLTNGDTKKISETSYRSSHPYSNVTCSLSRDYSSVRAWLDSMALGHLYEKFEAEGFDDINYLQGVIDATNLSALGATEVEVTALLSEVMLIPYKP